MAMLFGARAPIVSLKIMKKLPDSVNPSLWENTKNNHAYGLFEVTDGIYQVRGYDMANLTVIESDNGWIVFDPLMSVECTEAAMQLMGEKSGEAFGRCRDHLSPAY